MNTFTIYDPKNRVFLRDRVTGKFTRSECLAAPYFDAYFTENGKRRVVKLYSAWETTDAERARSKAAQINSENPGYNFGVYEINCCDLGAPLGEVKA